MMSFDEVYSYDEMMIVSYFVVKFEKWMRLED